MNNQYWKQQAKREVNIIIGNVLEADKELFFGPIFDFDVFTKLPSNARYPQLLKQIGACKSDQVGTMQRGS